MNCMTHRRKKGKIKKTSAQVFDPKISTLVALNGFAVGFHTPGGKLEPGAAAISHT